MSDISDAQARMRADEDDLIVEALASGRSYNDAAQLAGVSRRTVARRMEDPGFARRVADRRGETVNMLKGQLNELVVEALAAIRESLRDSEDSRNRLAAAKYLIDRVLRNRDHLDIQLELVEIRAILGVSHHGE